MIRLKNFKTACSIASSLALATLLSGAAFAAETVTTTPADAASTTTMAAEASSGLESVVMYRFYALSGGRFDEQGNVLPLPDGATRIYTDEELAAAVSLNQLNDDLGVYFTDSSVCPVPYSEKNPQGSRNFIHQNSLYVVAETSEGTQTHLIYVPLLNVFQIVGSNVWRATVPNYRAAAYEAIGNVMYGLGQQMPWQKQWNDMMDQVVEINFNRGGVDGPGYVPEILPLFKKATYQIPQHYILWMAEFKGELVLKDGTKRALRLGPMGGFVEVEGIPGSFNTNDAQKFMEVFQRTFPGTPETTDEAKTATEATP